MTWTRIAAHYRDGAGDRLASLAEVRASKLAKYATGGIPIGLDLTFVAFNGVWLLIADREGAQVKDELAPLAPFAHRAAEQMFTSYFRPDGPVSGDAVAAAAGVCMYEAVGLETDGALEIFKPQLVRVHTSRRDEYVHRHWNRALVALVLDDRRTWGPIAGLEAADPIAFAPGATFQFNVQGLVAYLAGAIAHHRDGADVMPAWRDFVRSWPRLTEAKMANEDSLLLAARLVHHHIGGQPLDTVAEFLRAEVQRAIAADANP